LSTNTITEEAAVSPIWVTKQQTVPNIDPGTYTLEVANVREVQVDDFDFPSQKTDRIEITFIIRDHPQWGGKQFTDLCTPRLGPKSKLGQIMTALAGGVAIPEGDVDVETSIGRRMQAAIRRKENGFNQVIAETAVPVHPRDS